MDEKDSDKRLLDVLKQKAEEIKAETQRLIDEVRDPQMQRKMKERLREFGTWAKETAEEAAERLEAAIKKAETAFTQRMEGSSTTSHTQAPSRADSTTTSAASAGAGPASAGKKTVGKGKRSAPGKKRAGKTIGKRK